MMVTVRPLPKELISEERLALATLAGSKPWVELQCYRGRFVRVLLPALPGNCSEELTRLTRDAVRVGWSRVDITCQEAVLYASRRNWKHLRRALCKRPFWEAVTP